MERMLGVEELLNEAGWLRRLAASLVGDAAQAEDLVQDTWVAALRRPPRARGELRPWLARVARNLARNTGRDRARRAAREDFVHEERADPGPDALAQEAEAQRLLAEAVTRLAEPLRAVIVLRYFQGLDSSAAAARLGVPASTLRTRLQKALEELRVDLDRRFEGGRLSWAALLAPLARGTSSGASWLSGPVAASAGVLGSWPVLAACAGAAGVLATLGAIGWSSLRAERGSASAPAAAEVAVASSAAPQENESSSAPERQALATLAENAPLPAADSHPTAGAQSLASELSGTILVDGRPPEWPITLALEPTPPAVPAGDRLPRKRMRPQEVLVAPEQHGAFRFGELESSWTGRLRVSDYSFADGKSWIALDAPQSGLVLQLRSGPEIVGRIRGPDGRPIPGLLGGARLRVEGEESRPGEIGTRFVCRADGAFRIPSTSLGERGTLTLLVQSDEHGYLRHETPEFALAAGLDLGELQLEPLRALEFSVRDAHGAPLEGVFASVDGPPVLRMKRAPLTGADGSGVLTLVPDRAVDVRFSAFAYRDRVQRVEPGTRAEVVLEPLPVLDIRLLGSLAARAVRVRVTAERAAFTWDASGWDEDARFQLELGRTQITTQRTPSATGPAFVYEFQVAPDGRLALAGVTPELALTVEALDADGLSLATGTLSVAREQRAALELGQPGAPGSEGAPLPTKRALRRATKSDGF